MRSIYGGFEDPSARPRVQSTYAGFDDGMRTRLQSTYAGFDDGMRTRLQSTYAGFDDGMRTRLQSTYAGLDETGGSPRRQTSAYDGFDDGENASKSGEATVAAPAGNGESRCVLEQHSTLFFPCFYCKEDCFRQTASLSKPVDVSSDVVM